MIFLMACVLSIGTANAAQPRMQVVKSSQAQPELLRNGAFEDAKDTKLVDWKQAPQGFRLAEGEGRNRSSALACESAGDESWFGASQSISLNRTNSLPLVVCGWSKTENVSGSADSGFALYADVTYNDNTPLWGQTASFRCGTHDWEFREFVIWPEKPVKTLTLHCLFRRHSGKVWFDDLSVREIRTEPEAVLFHGAPVRPVRDTGEKSGARADYVESQDGLRFALQDHAVTSLRLDEQELRTDAPSGFLVRDVAADSDFFSFSNGRCSELDLKLSAQFSAATNHLALEGRLQDTTSKDRAITLVFALPLDAVGWRWGDDIRRSRTIQGQGEFSNQIIVRCGATGAMTLYPVAPIFNDRFGLALALDLGRPAQCRMGYHAGTRQLFIAYDFGLVKESERFPSSADFRFVIFRFDPRLGFRAAFKKYMDIFPDYFRVRSRDQGIWMPFTDIATVPDWQDFGFKYHEGNNNVPFDDRSGILSFRYTEPMTWWMPMKKDAPRTLEEALRVRDAMVNNGSESARRMARASQIAGMQDEAGQPCLLFRNEPWCNGAVWSLNPNPRLPSAFGGGSADNSAEAAARPPGAQAFNAAEVHWNDALKERLYGASAKGQLDGEYLDSLEGYVTADLNFRREHFRYTTVPLTFSSDNKRPALFKGLAVFEFTKWICEDVHRLGKLTFANGVPYRFSFLCPWLDVMGTETDWLRGGRYQPASHTQMSLWRTMAGQKPYLLLMNTDYNALAPELVEKYFQRCLFYGMFPSMFSHNAAENPYWRNPKWYERDRPLFKKYIPIIKQVAEAGWQPITNAECDNKQILVERFGPSPDDMAYLTVFNDTDQPQTGLLRLTSEAISLTGRLGLKEMISGKDLPQEDSGWRISLRPQEAQVVRLKAER